MISGLFSDPSLQIAKSALDGLSLRRDLIGENIANVDTPGYRAQEVKFEQVLQRQMNNNSTIQMARTSPRHQLSTTAADLFPVTLRQGGSLRADQNSVDIDQELTDMTETGIRYQALTETVSKKLSILNAIATDRG